jgi:SAM-dependent methyltransferase
VVRHLAGAGIRQFLDIGSGIPTVGNVHEVAQAVAPQTRVVYVDIDPVTVAHSERMLARDPLTTVIEGDLRQPDGILDHPGVRGFLDLGQPVAVLLVAVLHFIDDADDPAGIVARLRRRLAPGSYVALSHGTQVPAGQERSQQDVRELYRRTPTPFVLRTPDQVAGLLAGMDLVEPGVVPATDWRPDPDDDAELPPQPLLAGLGRVR